MLDQIKSLFAVAIGGVVGGGTAVSFSNNNSGSDISSVEVSYETTTTSEGNSSDSTQSTQDSQVAETDGTSGSSQVEENNQNLIPALEILPIAKKEDKRNCQFFNFSGLDDVFYNLVGAKSYVSVFCQKMNTNSKIGLPNKWTILFPSELFSNTEAEKKFELLAEIDGSSENYNITFSSEELSPSSITGRKNEIYSGSFKNKNLSVEEINLSEPKSGNIFLVSVADSSVSAFDLVNDRS